MKNVGNSSVEIVWRVMAELTLALTAGQRTHNTTKTTEVRIDAYQCMGRDHTGCMGRGSHWMHGQGITLDAWAGDHTGCMGRGSHWMHGQGITLDAWAGDHTGCLQSSGAQSLKQPI